MTNKWETETLYSDKYQQAVAVLYQCERRSDDELNVTIRPSTAHAKDPNDDFYYGSFVIEGECVRATSLARNGMESLKGITYALLKSIQACTGKRVRSSIRYRAGEEIADAQDQLMGNGPQLWRRFEKAGRARYNGKQRRYYLS